MSVLKIIGFLIAACFFQALRSAYWFIVICASLTGIVILISLALISIAFV